MNKKARDGRREDVFDDDSLSALWVKSSLTQSHPGPMHVRGADIPLSQKGGLLLSLSTAPSSKSLIRNRTHYSVDPLAAHRTHSQVSFPFMPTIAWSPPKPHRPLQAQKPAHSVCLDGLCRANEGVGAG